MTIAGGTLLGPYEVIAPLGAGGMGEVYRAHDTRLGREVAVKVLPAAFSQDAGRLSRFEQEARAAGRLNHPNVLTIHDIGTYEGRPYIVSELLVGAELRAELRGGALAVRRVIDYALQIARGLAAAHEKDIVHRDLKPENLFVTTDGRVKILDFGLAKLRPLNLSSAVGPEAPAPISLTEPGLVMGTMNYMSPEQARGVEVDARTDIFSLGVVLYEMLTGRKPFERATASDVMAAVLLSEPPPLARYSSGVPPELERILGHMLVKDRERRYQTSGDLILDLTNLEEEIEFGAKLQRLAPRGTENARTEELSDQFSTNVIHLPPAETPPRPCRDPRSNLSVPPTPFVGRGAETAAVKRLLRQDGLRLLTLTGPGGTGKTRLMLQVASDLIEDFADGVWFVSLATISDPGLVASVIAQALEVKEGAGETLAERLKEHLRAKQALLLLDNFEQIVAAGPVVTELLSVCPRLKALVTSRAPLRLRWEHEFSVPPLAVPDLNQTSPGSLARSPSVDLFLQRARAVRPDFALTRGNARVVAEICARLDGLPLAIELAAARIKLLTPQALLRRLDQSLKLLTGGARDLPARQQTIRNTITWSCDLLGEGEKTLFRRLSVFVGGCTLEAVEAVCNGDGSLGPDALDAVASLVDNSLLQQKEQADGEPRFTLLQTIREYGIEQLDSSGEAAMIGQSHTRFFLELAEKAEPELTGTGQRVWLDRLELEHNNLRAALGRAAENGETETGLRLAGALWRFWLVRGHLGEGRERLAGILAATDAAGRSSARAKVLTGAATLAQNQGDYDLARALFEESLAIRRELGDENGVAASLTSLGWMAWRQGDYATARALSEKGLALHRELGHERGVCFALNNLGYLAHYQGDFALAHSLHAECVALWRKLGDKRGLAFSLTSLGWAAQKLGDADGAAALLEEALALIEQVGDRQLIAWTSCVRGGIALDQDLQTRAESLLEAGRAQFQVIGDKFGYAYALNLLGELRCVQGNPRQAKSLFSESLSLRCEIGDKHGTAECLERLARVAVTESRLKKAARLLGAAESQREALGTRLGAGEHLAFERLKEVALAGLGQQAFASTWAEGQAAGPNQAVAYALGEAASGLPND